MVFYELGKIQKQIVYVIEVYLNKINQITNWMLSAKLFKVLFAQKLLDKVLSGLYLLLSKQLVYQ